MIPRVVLDTNVYISALRFDGKPGFLLEYVYMGAICPLLSTVLKLELETTLSRKFGYSQDMLLSAEKRIWEFAEWIEPTEAVTLCRDEADNRVLECAFAGKAGFIVTGDRDLLDLADKVKIPILKPDAFLTHFYSERRKPTP